MKLILCLVPRTVGHFWPMRLVHNTYTAKLHHKLNIVNRYTKATLMVSLILSVKESV